MTQLKLQAVDTGSGDITIQVPSTSSNYTISLPAETGTLITNAGNNVMPAGAIATFPMITPPSGWLECNGAAVSRETYANLFTAIRTRYGVGDDSSTFNLPDLRGEFVRGFDNGRGVDADRDSDGALGLSQGDAIRNITGTFRTGKVNTSSDLATGAFTFLGNSPSGDGAQSAGSKYEFDASNVVPTANENRPRNIALLYCIKY